jgi:soluble lytic murein transglycosylase-like protein
VVLLCSIRVGANGAATPARAKTVSQNRAELEKLVNSVSLEHGVDPRLVDALVRVESDYDPAAVSRKGAMGLMQLMPETAKRLAVDDPFDPEKNIRGGVREFSRLVGRYSGNLQLALAAYNAGEGAVAKYRGVPPYEETRNYVSKILSLYTGRPYRLTGAYRAKPVRLVRDPQGRSIITNIGGASASSGGGESTLAGGPLRGGFAGK